MFSETSCTQAGASCLFFIFADLTTVITDIFCIGLIHRSQKAIGQEILNRGRSCPFFIDKNSNTEREKAMKNVKDSYEERFYSYDDMVDAIKANTEEDEWFKVKNQELRILPSTLEEFHDVSEEAVTDTMQNLGLSIYVKDRCFPMRDTVEKSLKERAGISGSALRRLSKKDLSTVLTLCLQTSPDLALAYISGEKVSALHSAKKKDYSVLPILDCIELLNKKLHGIFDGPDGDVCFKESYLSNWITQAKWIRL